jgi:acetyl-CoA C-acetyltransferase
MGVFAEATAKRYQFSREDQDAYAVRSMTRALEAQKNGAFNDEITPVTIKGKQGDSLVHLDEGPDPAKLAKIHQLRPAFDPQGTVTAANSSSISDGAASLIVMSASRAEQLKIKPLAKIIAHASFAAEPAWFTTAPVGAVRELLNKTQWQLDEVDLFEINEAFAVVAMAAIQDLHLPANKVNIHGGACALGHPIGASGARILVSLIHALRQQKKKRGIASLCIGGGEATAMAIEVFHA